MKKKLILLTIVLIAFYACKKNESNQFADLPIVEKSSEVKSNPEEVVSQNNSVVKAPASQAKEPKGKEKELEWLENEPDYPQVGKLDVKYEMKSTLENYLFHQTHPLENKIKANGNKVDPYWKRDDREVKIHRVTYTPFIHERVPSISNTADEMIFEGWHLKESGEVTLNAIYAVDLKNSTQKKVVAKNKFHNLRPVFLTQSKGAMFLSNQWKGQFHIIAVDKENTGALSLNYQKLCERVIDVNVANTGDICMSYFKLGKNETSIGILKLDGSFYPEALTGKDASWSRQGQQIVFVNQNGNFFDVFIANSNGSDLRQLTTHFGLCQRPSFSPDDQWVVFAAYTAYGQKYDLFIIRSNGKDLMQITNSKFNDKNPIWSVDGKIYFETYRFGEQADIAYLDPQTFIDSAQPKEEKPRFIK